jgi:tRNA-dihydrouridine synthase C
LGAAIKAYYREEAPSSVGWQDARELLIHFLEQNRRLYDPRYAVNPVKQWLVYLKVYYPQAAALFSAVKRITDADEMASALSRDEPLAAAA